MGPLLFSDRSHLPVMVMLGLVEEHDEKVKRMLKMSANALK
jgi:hypothetical protein